MENFNLTTTAAPKTPDMSTHPTPLDAAEDRRRAPNENSGPGDHSDLPALMDMQDDMHNEDYDVFIEEMSLFGLNGMPDQPSAEVETWADSCTLFNYASSVDDDELETLKNEFLDSLIKKNPSIDEIFTSESYALSDSEAAPTLPSAQHSSPGKSLTETATEQVSGEDQDEFAYEETDDPTVVRYKGEEYALFDGYLWQDGEKDSGIDEVSFTSLVDVESVENIFKVWDLRTSDDNEEDELTLEMRKAFGKDYHEMPYMTRKFDDPSVILNVQELDELVAGLTDLSLTETA